jgi:hypothetical protein
VVVALKPTAHGVPFQVAPRFALLMCAGDSGLPFGMMPSRFNIIERNMNSWHLTAMLTMAAAMLTTAVAWPGAAPMRPNVPLVMPTKSTPAVPAQQLRQGVATGARPKKAKKGAGESCQRKKPQGAAWQPMAQAPAQGTFVDRCPNPLRHLRQIPQPLVASIIDAPAHGAFP